MASSDTVPALATTFDLLGDETRLRIVQALAEEPGPQRFSDLRARVGTTDTGRFNYHLSRLRGDLVEKTADGYVLTRAGRRLAGVVTASLPAET